MEKRYLITQSLLSAWLYQYNCAEGYEEEARESFLKTLRREPTEPSEAMERGIAFENAVYETIRGNDTAMTAYTMQWSKRGGEVQEGACILDLAEELGSGTYQLTAYKEKTIAGEKFLLMAKCDWVKAGTIYDSKRVEHYEVGKYYASPQHPMYLEVLDGARAFEYKICDGMDIYTERYTRADIPQTIDSIITEFTESLKREGLWETYAKLWQTK